MATLTAHVLAATYNNNGSLSMGANGPAAQLAVSSNLQRQRWQRHSKRSHLSSSSFDTVVWPSHLTSL